MRSIPQFFAALLALATLMPGTSAEAQNSILRVRLQVPHNIQVVRVELDAQMTLDHVQDLIVKKLAVVDNLIGRAHATRGRVTPFGMVGGNGVNVTEMVRLRRKLQDDMNSLDLVRTQLNVGTPVRGEAISAYGLEGVFGFNLVQARQQLGATFYQRLNLLSQPGLRATLNMNELAALTEAGSKLMVRVLAIDNSDAFAPESTAFTAELNLPELSARELLTRTPIEAGQLHLTNADGTMEIQGAFVRMGSTEMQSRHADQLAENLQRREQNSCKDLFN